jgi:hypothetical protein
MEVEVACRLDGMLSLPEGRSVLEFKTMGDKQFFWLQGAFNGKLKAAPEGGLAAVVDRLREKHDGYWAQMQMSAAVFDEKKIYFAPKDRSMAQYGVWNKETGERFGVLVDRDQDYIDAKLRKFANIKQCVLAGEPPKAQFMDGSTECGYCAFYKDCYGKGK